MAALSPRQNDLVAGRNKDSGHTARTGCNSVHPAQPQRLRCDEVGSGVPYSVTDGCVVLAGPTRGTLCHPNAVAGRRLPSQA